jgi:hypothetical protein
VAQKFSRCQGCKYHYGKLPVIPTKIWLQKREHSFPCIPPRRLLFLPDLDNRICAIDVDCVISRSVSKILLFEPKLARDFRGKLIAENVPSNTPLYQYSQAKLRAYLSTLRSATLMVYLDGVQGLIEGMGGMAKWQLSTFQERMGFFQAAWNENPFLVAVKVNPSYSTASTLRVSSTARVRKPSSGRPG